MDWPDYTVLHSFKHGFRIDSNFVYCFKLAKHWMSSKPKLAHVSLLGAKETAG